MYGKNFIFRKTLPTPITGFTGQDIFTYEICSAEGTLCSSAIILVVVHPPPQAIDDVRDTTINTPVTIDVLSNDIGLFNLSKTTKLTNPSNGIVDPAINPDNTFTYIANTGFSGVDTFTYEICDTSGTRCSTATVTIYIENAPSFFPSQVLFSQPSESRCCGMSPLKWQVEITNLATSISGTILSNTPQRQALDWMTGEDLYCPGQCNFSDFEICERYSLAVFYFSTGGDSWTKYSKPDLTDQTAIDAANAACDITTSQTPPSQ